MFQSGTWDMHLVAICYEPIQGFYLSTDFPNVTFNINNLVFPHLTLKNKAVKFRIDFL